MRRLACLVCGLALASWLILDVGARAVGATLHDVGWMGLLTICGFHLLATTSMGLAWWNLRRTGPRWLFIWGRLVRDAGSEVLPLSQIGGYLIGARAMVLHGVAAAPALAATVVDATLEFCAEILFVVLGLVLLMRRSPGSALEAPAWIGLAGAIAAVIVFVAAQTRGSGLLARSMARLERRWRGAVLAGASAVQVEIQQIWRSRRRLLASFLIHFLAWIISGAEAWLALRLMGVSLSPAVVLIFESLLCAGAARPLWCRMRSEFKKARISRLVGSSASRPTSR